MANRIPLDSLCQPKVATLPNDFDAVIDYIDISSVDNESKTIIAHQEVDAKEAPSRARQLLQVGDVIVSTVRPNLNAVALVESAYENTLVGSTGYCVLRVKDGVDNRFIFYFCQSPYFVEDMTAQATGASYPAVTASIVRKSTLPAYTLEEQHEIAQHLDTVSTLISLRKQQIAKLDELVKARFVEMFGDCRTNTKGFECQKGIDLFKFSSGKFLPDEKRLERGIPVYGGNGIAWYTDTPLIHFPTIVIGRVGALCGNIHTVTVPAWITDNAIYIKEQKTASYTLEFLSELMRMMGFYQYADFSGQPKITQKPLESLSYIVPPLDLQRKYTAFVAQTDQQKLTIQHSLDKLELMKKALMQKYFG